MSYAAVAENACYDCDVTAHYFCDLRELMDDTILAIKKHGLENHNVCFPELIERYETLQNHYPYQRSTI